MRELLKWCALFVVAAAYAASMTWTAIRCDFNETALLVLGGLGFVSLLAVRGPGRNGWRVSVVAVVGLVAVVTTLGVARLGDEQKVYRGAVTRATMSRVAQTLGQYADRRGQVPDCAYPCVVEELGKEGLNTPLRIPVEGGEAVELPAVPMKDGWRCRYDFIKTSDRGFVLKSSGADRRFETDDDIIITPETAKLATPDPAWPAGPFSGWARVLNPVFVSLFFRPVG